MAKGRAWRNRLLLLLAASTFVLLVVADIAPNPLPPLWDWINRERPIAAEVDWQEQLGGRLSTAGIAGDTLAVEGGRAAQLRDRSSGKLLLDEWTADWLVVAGTGADAVVITGENLSRGYIAREADSGARVHEDDRARAVWGFQETWMDLRCSGPRSCELRAYHAGSGRMLWSAALPGAGSGMVGVQPELVTAGEPVPVRVDERVDAPSPAPPLLGVPLDRDRVAVIDSGSGEILAEVEAGRNELVMVVGQRVVRSVATDRDGVCQLAVSAHRPRTGEPVWGPEPYNLRTLTGGGCDQRHTAVAAGAALAAVDPRGHELVLDVNDGRVLWRGEPDERVQGLTEDVAVVRAADEQTRYGVLLGGEGARQWELSANEDADLVVADCGVIVADRDPDRLRVWDPLTGDELMSVRTSSRLLACAEDGLILTSGRDVGFAPFAGAGSPGSPGGVGSSGAPEGGK